MCSGAGGGTASKRQDRASDRAQLPPVSLNQPTAAVLSTAGVQVDTGRVQPVSREEEKTSAE